MKKLAYALTILLLLSLMACAAQTAGDTNAEVIGITVQSSGEWPENAYTQGLPVPTGKVSWATVDAEHESCGINVTDIDENGYQDYCGKLAQVGYSVRQSVSEEIAGQDSVSIGTLYSNGEKGLSISYIPGSLTIIYITREA